MNFRNTAIVVAIALALGAFVYFFEIKKESEQEGAISPGVGTLLDVNPEDVVDVLVREGHNVTHVSKAQSGGTWVMEQPAHEEADADRVRRAISLLVRAQPSRTIALKEAGNLSDFGLENPATVITLTLASGTSLTLWVGEQTPQATHYYVMKAGGDTIYLLSNSVVNAAKQLVSQPPYRPTPTPTEIREATASTAVP